jgi:ribose transport system substrate-binding protein
VQGLPGARVLQLTDCRSGTAPAGAGDSVGPEIRHTTIYTSVADYTADFQIPALRAGGVDPKDVILVSADGNKSAYERIRAGGQYQLVTASEPYEMQAYQAIDELNRAFNKQPPSGFIQTPYLVTPENIDAEGGDKNTFIPSNDYARRYLELWGVQG